MELPVFKRCCCCCPLRPGLIAWGYIKLVLTVVFPISMLSVYIEEYYMFIPFFFDSILMVTFLISAHIKNYELMKVYYYYSFVIIALSVMTIIACAIVVLWQLIRGDSIFLLILCLCVGCVLIGTTLIQIYMTLLIKSEIVKLKDNTQCKFIKAAALASDESGVTEKKTEKVKYDRFYSQLSTQTMEV